ncbi:ATP-binding protein [Candidatus Kaiserbacteria bacterium]|nr:ATP-binding protein [Candidatus Kaiserbacteria bacterium]
MRFKRTQSIEANKTRGRALIIYGPRRVGKTTLLKAYLGTQIGRKIFLANGDDLQLRSLFASQIRDDLLKFAQPHELLAIDEAQQVPHIGLGIKMIIDEFPDKEIVLTGSSSFDLSQRVGEPLTGRHFTLTLLPLAQSEIEASEYELKNALSDFLVYGSYPEILNETNPRAREKILNELVSSYLFKDILALDTVRSPDALLSVVRALAFQIGSEVSLSEVARLTHLDGKTVRRYIDVLEKMFVIKKVRAYSRNLRNEISKKAKYYFLDNGVRNALIHQFNALELRNDVGALWENFIFMELYKKSVIEETADSFYFWRTHAGQEIDIIRESSGKISAIECKWQGEAKVPALWSETYPGAKFEVINRKNYLDVFLV